MISKVNYRVFLVMSFSSLLFLTGCPQATLISVEKGTSLLTAVKPTPSTVPVKPLIIGSKSLWVSSGGVFNATGIDSSLNHYKLSMRIGVVGGFVPGTNETQKTYQYGPDTTNFPPTSGLYKVNVGPPIRQQQNN